MRGPLDRVPRLDTFVGPRTASSQWGNELGTFQWIDLMSGIIIHHFIFRIGLTFHPKPGNHWFQQNQHLSRAGFLSEIGLLLHVWIKPPCTKWPDGRVLVSRLLLKKWLYKGIYHSDRGFRGKTCFSYFLCNKLISSGFVFPGESKGGFYFGKRHSFISGRTS